MSTKATTPSPPACCDCTACNARHFALLNRLLQLVTYLDNSLALVGLRGMDLVQEAASCRGNLTTYGNLLAEEIRAWAWTQDQSSTKTTTGSSGQDQK